MKNKPDGSLRIGDKQIRQEIDVALNIGFVDWKQISQYMNKLESLLEAIKAFGKDQPADAYGVITYFLESIPAIFNSVHDECEIKMFCEELMEAAVTLGRASAVSGAELGRFLIDGYMSHVSDTCRLNDALEVLLKAHLDKNSRQSLASYVLEQAVLLKDYDTKELLKFAGKLRGQPSPRTATVGGSAGVGSLGRGVRRTG